MVIGDWRLVIVQQVLVLPIRFSHEPTQMITLHRMLEE